MAPCICVIPPALAVERARLAALGGTLFGVCPDDLHGYGHHLPSCRLPADDYSLRYGRGNPQHSSAIDIGMDWPRSRQWLLWLVAECRAGRKRGVVEIIGQPTGRPVLYWSQANGWREQLYLGAGHDRWTHVGCDRTVLASAADLRILAWKPTAPAPTPAPGKDTTMTTPRDIWTFDPQEKGGGGIENRTWRHDYETNPHVRPAWAIGWLMDRNYETRNKVDQLLAGQARQAGILDAILAATTGQDHAAIMAHIDSQAETTRAQVGAQVAAVYGLVAQLGELVEQGQSGRIDAADVLRQMGQLLAQIDAQAPALHGETHPLAIEPS